MGSMGESWIKEVVGYGLNIVDLDTQGVFIGSVFIISRNQLALRGPFSPQASKALQKTIIKCRRYKP